MIEATAVRDGEALEGAAGPSGGPDETPPGASTAEPAPEAFLQQVNDLRTQGEVLRQELTQRDQEMQRLRESLDTAVMKYRQALMAAYPVIPEELLSGSTVEELEASLERARTAVEQVRRKLEEDMGRTLSVPAGAPVRRPPDASSLSAREKIVHGLKA